MRFDVLLIFPCILLNASAFADSPTLGDALKTLHSPKADNRLSAVYVEAIGVVGKQAKSGDAEAFNSLLGCVKAEELASPVRAEALRVAISLADEKQFATLSAAMAGIAKGIPSPGTDSIAKPEYYAGSSLLGIFLDALPRATSEPAALLASLRDWAIADVTRWEFGWVYDKAVTAIAAATASESDRRRHLIDIIEAAPKYQPLPDNAVMLLADATSRDVLRGLITKHAKHQFNFAAASVLAHLGDATIVDAINTQRQKEPAGFSQGVLDFYLRQIEVQNPPAKLLEFIGSADHPSVQATTWALERASQLGLDKAAIRAALVSHCKQYNDPSDKAWMTKRPQVVAVATGTGILSQDDRAIPPANPVPPSPYGQFSQADKH
ncbi:MAG: hypothetical protein KF841_03210 [Phycisphaerae bacterium]|nr:hypothetical protein [Phycisphaerae bacterium]